MEVLEEFDFCWWDLDFQVEDLFDLFWYLSFPKVYFKKTQWVYFINNSRGQCFLAMVGFFREIYSFTLQQDAIDIHIDHPWIYFRLVNHCILPRSCRMWMSGCQRSQPIDDTKWVNAGHLQSPKRSLSNPQKRFTRKKRHGMLVQAAPWLTSFYEVMWVRPFMIPLYFLQERARSV